ncbi:MAG: hypothetical protein NVS1B4_04570 [Gemmatimonadaceae bacterium]
MLYGSAARGTHVAGKSDYNVLVLVDSLDFSHLKAASSAVREWGDAGNPPPLVLTTEEWHQSADVFALEYADILARHRVLEGSLPTAGLTVAPSDIRLQLEHEARGKLMRLRRAVLAAGDDGDRQLAILDGSFSAFMVVFRGLARLHGEEPPPDNVELARSVARRIGFDESSFVRVARHVRGEESLDPGDAATILAAYLGALERLVAHVDAFGTEGRSST